MMGDLFALAWKNLTHRRHRTALTVTGIVIGIAAILLLISVGQGFKASMTQMLESFGADNITILPGSGGLMGATVGAQPFTEQDVKAVERVPNVVYVAGIAARNMEVSYGGKTLSLVVYGYPEGAMQELFGKVMSTYLESGRLFKRGDLYVAIIGYSVAHDLFGKDIPVGRTILINGQRFRVIGTMVRFGDQIDDTSVNIPLDAFKRLVGNQNVEYMMIMAKVRKGVDVQRVADEIKRKLDETRGKGTFQVLTSEDMLKQVNNVLSVITIIVIGIAAIALIVGAVGIMNTMYMSVTERTKEIGVMKAVGATKWQIMAIFLLEAGMLGLIGGVVGEGIAVALSLAVQHAIRTAAGITYYSSYLGADLLLGAAAFGFVLGIIAGLLPAKRAADLNPVEALRYE